MLYIYVVEFIQVFVHLLSISFVTLKVNFNREINSMFQWYKVPWMAVRGGLLPGVTFWKIQVQKQ